MKKLLLVVSLQMITMVHGQAQTLENRATIEMLNDVVFERYTLPGRAEKTEFYLDGQKKGSGCVIFESIDDNHHGHVFTIYSIADDRPNRVSAYATLWTNKSRLTGNVRGDKRSGMMNFNIAQDSRSPFRSEQVKVSVSRTQASVEFIHTFKAGNRSRSVRCVSRN